MANYQTTGNETTGNGTSISTSTFTNASGWVIDNGLILTAGHVVYEWNRINSTPSPFNLNPVYLLSNIHDFRGYATKYRSQISNELTNNPTNPAGNKIIEGQPSVYYDDIVSVSVANSTIGSEYAGIATFLDHDDLDNMSSILGNDISVTRYGSINTSINAPITTAVNGSSVFYASAASDEGDSGGAYILQYESLSFVIGVHSGDFVIGNDTVSVGVAITPTDFQALNTQMAAGKSGDVSLAEPVNLVVGTSSQETIQGSYRSDLILGMGGNDTLNDGDDPADTVWADDTLRGGAGNDTLIAGKGSNTLDGGADTDTVDYSSFTGAVTFNIGSLEPEYSIDTISVDRKVGGVSAGQDLLISIEKMYGTSGADEIAFNHLEAEQVGFPEDEHEYRIEFIDLGDGSDIVDASSYTPTEYDSGLTFDFSSEDQWVGGTLEEYGLSVRNAEAALGSELSDYFVGAYYDYHDYGRGFGTFSETTVPGFYFDGGGGDDGFEGGAGNDSLYGGDGDDYIVDGRGDDIVDGGDGNDYIYGGSLYEFYGSDNDTIAGGAGDDTFGFIGEQDFFDSIDGGSGTDSILAVYHSTVFRLAALSGVEVISADGYNDVSIALSDSGTNLDFSSVTLTDIAEIDGGSGDDTITGSSSADTIVGGGGNDSLAGGYGNDVFNVTGTGDGFDAIDGGAGTDTISALANNTVIGLSSLTGVEAISAGTFTGVTIAGSGNADALDFSSVTLTGITKIDGGSGNDTLIGSTAADTIVGGAGDDSLAGDGGNDIFQVSGSGDGFDAVDGGSGTDTIQAQAANTTIGLRSLTNVEAITANGFTGVTIAGSSSAETLDFTSVTLTSITQIGGGAGNDTITGTGGADNISGGSDADSLIGAGGNDTLSGDAGDDTLNGGAGDDSLSGGDGNDLFLFSGTGDGFDAVDGGSGTDTLSALANNTVIGLTSVIGVEAITANGFTGVYVGGSSIADTLDLSSVTLTSITKIDGGSGNDSLTGSTAADTLVGGSGNDLLSGRAGNDSIDGGADSDTVDYSYASAAWTINLSAGSSQGTSGSETDTIANVEHVIGGSGNDTITGTSVSNSLNGGDGNDSITGGDGDDSLSGGDGGDVFRVSGTTSGADYIDGGGGSDTITATANNTTIGLHSVANVETITSGGYSGVYVAGTNEGNESFDFTNVTLTGILAIDGNAGNDSIIGSTGADTIWGSEGNDTLLGGDGNDSITGGADDDSMAGGDGNDVFRIAGTTDFDDIDGGSGSDTITAYANSATIGLRSVTNVETITSGGYSNTIISGTSSNESFDFSTVTLSGITRIDVKAGNDIVIGSSAADTIWGSEGDDTLSGGGGNDSILGGDGTDVLSGGAGNDTLNGQNGTDTVDYSYASAAWTINLAAASAQGTSGSETDTISNVENVIGGTGADNVTGTSSANLLAGNDGADTISGSGGNDTLQGGAGDDRLTGGTGNDSIEGGAGTDVAVFAGLQATYSITTSSGTVTIVDNNTSQDGNDGTDTLVGVETAEFKGAVQVSLGSPIVLDLNGDGVELIDKKKSKATFDWDGDGDRDKTGWVGKDDGMLVFDRNGDGSINAANELSFVDDKPGAKSDLDGLSAFDSNNDGIFSADDDAFESFGLWRDRNGDGKSQKNELMTLADAGIASINLAGAAVNRSWGWDDNLTINTGSFTRVDGSEQTFSDVALNYTETKSGRSRYAASLAANQFAEAIAAFRPRGGDEVTLGKHDMEMSKTPVFAGERDRYS